MTEKIKTDQKFEDKLAKLTMTSAIDDEIALHEIERRRAHRQEDREKKAPQYPQLGNGYGRDRGGRSRNGAWHRS